MPVIADLEMAREIVVPALEKAPLEHLKLLGLLSDKADPSALREVRVDDFHDPSGALIQSGSFFSFHASDEGVARLLLAELDWLWTRPLSFSGVHESLVPIIEEFADLRWQNPCWRHHLPPDTPRNRALEHRGPSALRQPNEDDIKRILTWWPYGEPDNTDDQHFLARRLASGLASGWWEGDELVSWALTGDDLSLGFMHTLEAWRSRGHGLTVAADLTLKVRDAGLVPYCFVVEDNPAPLKMLDLMGYERSESRYVWLGTTPR